MPDPRAPANQRAVRRHNLGVVLRDVVNHGPRSRATVAVHTGLNKSTVSSLVTELIELGVLVERGADRRGSVGRPGLVLSIAEQGAVALGLEINVDHLSVSAVDLAGDVRHSAQEPGDHRRSRPPGVLDQLAALARDALDDLRGQGLRVAGAAVALPGLADTVAGVLLVAPNLGWGEVAVVDELHARLGEPDLPLLVDNEANLAALAELWLGAGRGLRDFVHVSGEIGVGAGVVLGGELWRGARGFGGELGHLTVEPDGLPCACGSRGCLETRAGLDALLSAAGAPSREELEARARAGDRRALSALDQAGRWLGVACSSAANLLDLEAILLGGAYAPLAGWLGAGMEGELRTRVLGSQWGVPRVVPAALGMQAAVRGAAALVLRHLLDDPASLARQAG
jgi:predicted NBD/HSP70 family sugar kinase